MKRIVIVGASSGLGLRMARDFARVGCQVALAARRTEPLKEIADKYPGRVVYKSIDVTAPDAVSRFLDLVEMNNGMDYLIYCAGVGYMDPLLEQQKTYDTVSVNCLGMATICSAAYRYYRDTASVEPGHIAAITSVAGDQAIGIAAAYSASKAFEQRYLTALEQLAIQEEVNLKVTDIRPGFIETPLLKGRKYPMMMTLGEVAPKIEECILRGRRVAYVDGRWNVVARLWRAIPTRAWVHVGLVPDSAARIDRKTQDVQE